MLEPWNDGRRSWIERKADVSGGENRKARRNETFGSILTHIKLFFFLYFISPFSPRSEYAARCFYLIFAFDCSTIIHTPILTFGCLHALVGSIKSSNHARESAKLPRSIPINYLRSGQEVHSCDFESEFFLYYFWEAYKFRRRTGISSAQLNWVARARRAHSAI